MGLPDMLNLQEYTCPVCGRSFTPEDDVVICPDCGAPHHRECWKQAGRCHFAALHGTAAQWRPVPSRSDEGALVCGNCGAANLADSRYCRKCGRALDDPPPLRPEDQNPPVDPNAFSPPYTPYGEVPPDGIVGGETAMDLATFIGSNSGYYLPRFQYMEKSRNGVSWNWAAALFPAFWLLYRKMRRLFLPVLATSVILSLPWLAVAFLGFRAMAADPSALQAFLSGGVIPEGSTPAWLLLSSHLSSMLSLTLHGVMGMRANDLYRRHTKRLMNRIRLEGGDALYYRYALARRGGVSAGSVVGAAFCLGALAAVVCIISMNLALS